MQLRVVWSCFIASASVSVARAQCADWSDRFVSNGVDGSVKVLDVFDDGSGPRLLVAGGFATATGIDVARVAGWNGSAFAPLDQGLTGATCCDPLEALSSATFDDGSGPALYVGGRFISAGGVTVNNIAKWDGANWSALGSGVDGGVQALAVFDDGSGPALYAAGGFLNASGVSAPGIARWNGSSWSALGAGTTTDAAIKLRALAVFDDGSGPALYAGGHIFNYNGVNLGYIGRWNGSTWSKPGAGFNTVVEALYVYDDGAGPTLLAGGFFDGVFKWNGSVWSWSGGNIDGRANAFAAFDDGSGPALFVGGNFDTAGGLASPNLAKWNGASWSAVGTGTQDAVQALTVFDDGNGAALFIGGAFLVADNRGANHVVRYDGSSWSALGTGAGTNEGASAVAEADLGNGVELYAGGRFNAIGDTAAKHFARWDGSQWIEVGGGVEHTLTACTVDEIRPYDDGSGLELYVGGEFNRAGGSVAANNIARWDGVSWYALGAGTNDEIFAVEFFDDGSGTKLYVGGYFTSAGGVSAAHVAAWDGSTWSALGSGLNGLVHDLEVFDDGSGPALYVAGSFSQAGGSPASRIARWNGSSWSSLGTGTNSAVFTLLAHDDGSGPALYAGGDFTQAGGVGALHIARWNGSAWSSVGGGVSGTTVSSLETFDDGSGLALFAAGLFSTAGSTPAKNIAKWDGTSWSALGAGVDPYTSDMTAYKDENDDGAPDLVLAGSMTEAGGLPSSGIAAWHGCPPPLGTPYCFGDGNGTSCPCGNTSASGAQQGCAHSVGYGAHLGALGSTSIATDNQVLMVSSMPANKSCVLFVGNAALNGGNGVHFGDGLRCAGPSVHRLGVRTSDAFGVANWGPGFSALNYWSAGDTRYFQVWFRDPTGPCGNATNLSSALAVTFSN